MWRQVRAGSSESGDGRVGRWRGCRLNARGLWYSGRLRCSSDKTSALQVDMNAWEHAHAQTHSSALCFFCQCYWTLTDNILYTQQMYTQSPSSSMQPFTYECIRILQPLPNVRCLLNTCTCAYMCARTHTQKWHQTSQGVRETQWGERGSLLASAFTASHPPLMATHDKSSIQTRGGGDERQSMGMETQRMSLAAATAWCWYNMAVALVVTGAPNLWNKRSIQWQQHWHHGEKSGSADQKNKGREREERHMGRNEDCQAEAQGKIQNAEEQWNTIWLKIEIIQITWAGAIPNWGSWIPILLQIIAWSLFIRGHQVYI